MKRIFAKIKELLHSLCQAVIRLLASVPKGQLYRFIIGMLVGAFFAITLRMQACFVPVLFLAFIIQFVRLWRGKEFNVKSFLAMLLGSVSIFILVLI